VVNIREEVILASIHRFEEEEKDHMDISDIEQFPCIHCMQNAGISNEVLLDKVKTRMAQITANHRIAISALWN